MAVLPVSKELLKEAVSVERTWCKFDSSHSCIVMKLKPLFGFIPRVHTLKYANSNNDGVYTMTTEIHNDFDAIREAISRRE